MSQTLDLFLALRHRNKVDRRNASWAKIDRMNYLDLYRSCFPEAPGEAAAAIYLQDLVNGYTNSASMNEINKGIKSHFRQLSNSRLALSTPYLRSKAILKAWLAHWSDEQIRNFLSSLRRKFFKELQMDQNALLDVITDIYIKLHHMDQSRLSVALLNKVAGNRDIRNRLLTGKNVCSLDEKIDVLADSMYYIVREKGGHTVIELFALIRATEKLSKNDKLIMDTAHELCTIEVEGINRKEKMANFKRLFKERMAAADLTGNTLNQALSRLRDKLARSPVFMRALIDENKIHTYSSMKIRDLKPSRYNQHVSFEGPLMMNFIQINPPPLINDPSNHDMKRHDMTSLKGYIAIMLLLERMERLTSTDSSEPFKSFSNQSLANEALRLTG